MTTLPVDFRVSFHAAVALQAMISSPDHRSENGPNQNPYRKDDEQHREAAVRARLTEAKLECALARAWCFVHRSPFVPRFLVSIASIRAVFHLAQYCTQAGDRNFTNVRCTADLFQYADHYLGR